MILPVEKRKEKAINSKNIIWFCDFAIAETLDLKWDSSHGDCTIL